uniref:Uncharacterized protein n=1 Tax=Rhizophora mucronata TaxID=61149 RepID=A0A2P2R238_RHIMU
MMQTTSRATDPIVVMTKGDHSKPNLLF